VSGTDGGQGQAAAQPTITRVDIHHENHHFSNALKIYCLSWTYDLVRKRPVRRLGGEREPSPQSSTKGGVNHEARGVRAGEHSQPPAGRAVPFTAGPNTCQDISSACKCPDAHDRAMIRCLQRPQQ
jgi:hypothetical protein